MSCLLRHTHKVKLEIITAHSAGIINSHYSERTSVSPANITFGKSFDLDRGIFSEIPEDEMYAKRAELLKTQSDIIERHKQVIQKGDINHTLETASAKYTVFDTGSYVYSKTIFLTFFRVENKNPFYRVKSCPFQKKASILSSTPTYFPPALNAPENPLLCSHCCSKKVYYAVIYAHQNKKRKKLPKNNLCSNYAQKGSIMLSYFFKGQ